MPYLASSLPVTRVSSQKMRSAPCNTASARSVMSPRLPIGVATRYSPGASSVSDIAPAGCGAAAGPGGDDARGSGLLAFGRRLGYRLLPAFLSEPALAAPVALAVRL